MNQDQRLIPFLGGLILGGVGGAAAEGNKMMPYNYGYGYNYYPPYYTNYQYPTYNYYQNVPNQNTPIVNSMEHPLYNMPYNQYQFQTEVIAPGKIINENPVPVILTSGDRNVQDMSYVPKYIP